MIGSGGNMQQVSAESPATTDSVSREVPIINKRGLHARSSPMST